jgi:hypothetical protein
MVLGIPPFGRLAGQQYQIESSIPAWRAPSI